MDDGTPREPALDLSHWRATRWRRAGYDRLYVHAASGVSVGWYDLGTGDLHAVEPPLTEALTAFVLRWLDSEEARAIGPLPAPHPPTGRAPLRPRHAPHPPRPRRRNEA